MLQSGYNMQIVRYYCYYLLLNYQEKINQIHVSIKWKISVYFLYISIYYFFSFGFELLVDLYISGMKSAWSKIILTPGTITRDHILSFRSFSQISILTMFALPQLSIFLQTSYPDVTFARSSSFFLATYDAII